MIIIGVGSNIGDRLQHLQTALSFLTKEPLIKVLRTAPVYESQALIPEDAPNEWLKDYLNTAIAIETTLAPQELLAILKKIENDMGRRQIWRWAPRIIDLDILCWHDVLLKQESLTIPHAGLERRPFALWPLLDLDPQWVHPEWREKASLKTLVWGSRFSGEAPFHTHQCSASLNPTELVGVINVTPDSFSDGGLCCTIETALNQAEKLIKEGASVLDLGAESTAPKAAAINSITEWQRLAPVLTAIRLAFPKIGLSVDTRHADVAAKAIAAGANWINDVSGFRDPNMIAVVREASVNLVVMHSLSIPEDRSVHLPKDQDPVHLVLEWGRQVLDRLEASGIARERCLFDVGIGFGKHQEQSLLLLKRIAEFHALGVRLFVGHSRKTFLAMITNKPFGERDLETAVLSCYLAQQGVHYLRVHNVEMSRRALLADRIIR